MDFNKKLREFVLNAVEQYEKDDKPYAVLVASSLEESELILALFQSKTSVRSVVSLVAKMILGFTNKMTETQKEAFMELLLKKLYLERPDMMIEFLKDLWIESAEKLQKEE